MKSLNWLALCLLTASVVSASQPNILFILADDLSWSDPACYGNTIFETPHLDRLASEGVLFDQAYAPAPICSASRASILTGNSVARNRFEFVVKDKPGEQTVEAPLRAPPFTINLELASTALPELLSPVASPTIFYGKWHLNAHHQGYLGWSPTHGPKQHGFQKAIEGFGSHPYSYRRQTKPLPSLELAEGQFPEDSMTGHAVESIKRAAAQENEKPFFPMVSHYYVHDPVHSRIDWLKDHYRQKIPDTHPRHEVLVSYGAMVTTLDHYVGELLDALDESGLTDSTLVVFTSDNGGHPNYAGNAPLRGSKWNLYEGGIRVPFLARLPGTTHPGTTCSVPVSSTDLFATFADLCGLPAPSGKDSISLLPLLGQPDLQPEERTFVWHFPYYHPEKNFETSPETIGVDDGVTSQTRPHSALRQGDWKLLHFYEDGRDELYQLSSDPYEQQDLSDQHPDKARSLRTTLDHYLESVDARFARTNPDFSLDSKSP